MPTAPIPPLASLDGNGRQVGGFLPLAYRDLRALAQCILGRRRLGDPLRTTSLVHDTYLKLAACEGTPCRDREHFLAIAAKAMRWVLVDHARRLGAHKRSPNGERIELDAGVAKSDVLPANLLAIDEALTRLAALDERRARIVELRFFGGLTVEETAAILGISTPTVKRDWRLARAWLYREIHGR